MMRLKRVDEICSLFKCKNILIFGDVILDRYIFGSVNRISPEAPVPVVKVEREEFRAGGAGNVAANVDKLGAGGILVGITGDDIFSDELAKLKSRNNRALRSPENKTLVKTRVIGQRQQIVRIDREEDIRVTREMETALLEKIETADVDGIIVSDYAKGTLTAPLMEGLKRKALAADIPVVVDPKPPHYHLYKNIDGITPNQGEAESIINKKIKENSDAAAAVKLTRNKFNAKFSIITRGDRGITAGEKGKKTFHLPAFSHEVFDVTGAGDTVVSVLVLALVSGAGLREAVALANAAASIVVEKIGTSQVTVEELRERMKFLLHRT
ncbi:MAG: D-glycero-beta-D-manno-heptose-7-phosphate kinase [bacterium]|nr:D-glycero-beta-D-manno-heptose-7-phosphate kinase [bacterium]